MRPLWVGGYLLSLCLGAWSCDGPAPRGQAQCMGGGVMRGDTTQAAIALVFTAHTFAEGGAHIQRVLADNQVKASFFLTGDAYRNPVFTGLIRGLRADGHYLGAHSDRHLLYCPWERRDSLLVSRDSFRRDLQANYAEMARFGIEATEAPFFMPPFEWYNDSISAWTRAEGKQLINFTPGTLSQADYTTPDLPHYRSSEEIMASILAREGQSGLNGYILLIHLGAGPGRADKFYLHLQPLMDSLRGRGYRFCRIDDLPGVAAGCPEG